jgi:hypothetical protein
MLGLTTREKYDLFLGFVKVFHGSAGIHRRKGANAIQPFVRVSESI